MEKKKSERNIFGFDGSFINFCDKLFDVMALGFLWILCSLPIITIGASSTALYYAMVKCIKKGDGYITREFFHSFRMNLIPGTILWVLIAAATFAMHLNIGILMKETDGKVKVKPISVRLLQWTKRYDEKPVELFTYTDSDFRYLQFIFDQKTEELVTIKQI